MPQPAIFDQHQRYSAQYNILDQIKSEGHSLIDMPEELDNLIDAQRLSVTLQEQGQTYQGQAH